MSTAHITPDGSAPDGGSTISRRGLLGVGAAATAGMLAGGGLLGAAPAGAATGENSEGAVLRPAVLRPGDRVRVVSPARTPDSRLARGIEILESFGLVVEVGAHALDTYGYLAGTDEDRAADLNDAFGDPGVRGVFASRGGYGTERIIGRFDIAAARADPKVFVGFSDLTALHLRLQGARIPSWYGPMVNWSDSRTGPDSIESLRRAIMTTEPVTIARDPAEPSAAVEVAGRASGLLIGGNLTLLDSGIATAGYPSLHRAILLFEDVDEAPYSYDQMLTHLLRTGLLRQLAGVAIGQLTNADGGAGEWDAPSAIRDRLADLGVPVLGGLPIGHGPGQLTVPLGVPATIDTEAGTLTVEPGVRPATTTPPSATATAPTAAAPAARSALPRLPTAPVDPSTPEW